MYTIISSSPGGGGVGFLDCSDGGGPGGGVGFLDCSDGGGPGGGDGDGDSSPEMGSNSGAFGAGAAGCSLVSIARGE